MDDAQLKRSLQSIGKSCFVDYYQVFHNKSRTDPSFVINFLFKTRISNEAGAKIRVGYARGIFNAGRENDALKIIATSPGVPPTTQDQAKLLLNGGTALLPLHPPLPISVVAETIAIDTAILDYIRKATASELLALYAATLDELRERGIVRSANGPGGDYAELLFVEAFG